MSTRRIAVLISGSGSNLQAILDATANGGLPGVEVALVVSNRRDAFGLDRAIHRGVPAVWFPPAPYTQTGRPRAAYDAGLAALVAAFDVRWVVLAGWMRLLSQTFLDRFPARVINLHPALPGQFPGTHAIQRAFEAFHAGRITHTGVMVHLVPDEAVDAGPVLAQEIVPIHPHDTVDDLEARIHTVEHRLLVRALREVLCQAHPYPLPGLGDEGMESQEIPDPPISAQLLPEETMLYGDRIRLRAIERTDLPTFVRWFNDPEVRRHLAIYAPLSAAMEERWFEAQLDSKDAFLFAIEAHVDDAWVHIGNAGLSSIDWKNRHAVFGIALGEKAYWGQGYGTDATRTVLCFAFHELNLHRVELEVYDQNPRARRCYEKSGFRHEGIRRQALFRDGRYLDTHRMAVLREEFGDRREIDSTGAGAAAG